jgi:hypothetical protein
VESASSDQSISLPRSHGATCVRDPDDHAPLTQAPLFLQFQEVHDPTQAKPRSVDEFTTRASLAIVFPDLTANEIEAAAQLREKHHIHSVGKHRISSARSYDLFQEESRIYDKREMTQQHALAAEYRQIKDPQETANSQGLSCDNEYTW